MKKKRIHNVNTSKTFRKYLRGNLTTAEASLCNHLKNKKLMGRKFRRQHGILNFIVDFYSFEEKLVIELDGEIHYNATKSVYDDERSKKLETLGNTVIRFENKMVFENLQSVLTEITQNFKAPSLD